MKTVHSKQNRKGFFSYLGGYDTAEQYLEVEFSMEIMVEGESFTGTFTSSESKHVFNEPNHDQSLSEFTEEIFNGKFEMRRS